ncbi:DUF6255 family natural product biosynthesis protein [Streptomyces sp. AV19]|uniref:DUF6255 family natural product biosynthesis protein n=1 Tax=Streptomyces sp. AV19 TaxID=2793068 RepID=UPI0035ABE93B
MTHPGPRCRWESAGGQERCTTCGTRRFTDYGALRPRELPPATGTTSPSAVGLRPMGRDGSPTEDRYAARRSDR